MNNTTLGIVGVSVVALAGIAAVTLMRGNSGSTFGIVVHAPTSEINDPTWDAIDGVLKRSPITPGADSRDMLYRTRKFAGGDPVPNDPSADKDDGKLPLTQLLGDREKTLGELKKENFTGHAFQIGVGADENYQHLPSNSPNMPQAHYRQNILESKEMVDDVNNVLGAPSPTPN